jgi:cephalosporin hydroxylase
MNRIEWLNDKEFSIDGIKFLCSLGDYSLKTNDERVIILKDRGALKSYDTVFAGMQPRTMLEFGIFQGGSPTLFSLWFKLDKFVGIDLSPPVEGFEAFCARQPVGKKIRSYYAVSQTDRIRVDQIVRDEFSNTLLDVIIDDASHLYDQTRRTFEIAFPHLRPGGTYVVEDWGWAHWPQSDVFMGKTAMSVFIMELIMLCASRSDLISEVRIFPAFVFVRKSQHAPAMTEMDLSSLYNKRGIGIIGADGMNWRDLVRFFSQRLSSRLKNELRRLRKRIM